ncbi:hypothetical protein [Flavihumibacter fluvii]|uniref:hypothetical protein n=1 Tax=Flavihumibacter fluvii TaxID=2838157 RepID=UPI001BDEC765|nr:hypothetical protein [Flavihumibacter fluvii]ULQ54036.1 hypothetical protein KJS93_06855 [Flavihumibacter fluvii]
MKKNAENQDAGTRKKDALPGNPEYPASEDIYSQAKKESIDKDGEPGAESKKKDPSPDEELDIPGTELDDADENIGEEDEENNYYSLGGDNHSNLDEN